MGDSAVRLAGGVTLQQEVAPRVSVEVGYNRRWWGNHFFTDNRAIGPQDFDTATIKAPINANLPNGGGNDVTFVTRNTRSALGATDNYYTFASDFGESTTYWHGVDFWVNARTRNGITFQGGTSTGSGRARLLCDHGHASRTVHDGRGGAPESAAWRLCGR